MMLRRRMGFRQAPAAFEREEGGVTSPIIRLAAFHDDQLSAEAAERLVRLQNDPSRLAHSGRDLIMALTWRPEANGVWTGHFTDTLDRPCVLRQSTRDVPVLCLGLKAAGWMHLTREQVNALLPHLLRFVETGSLREKQEAQRE